MNKQLYDISLIGCCGSNHFQMELTQEEYELLKRVGEKSDQSTDTTEPVLTIDKEGV